MVLKGDDDIADQGERPAHPVGVAPTYRQGPRVANRVRIALGNDLGLRRIANDNLDDAVDHLLGGLFGRWNTITSRTTRLSTGARSLMATPPTASPGRMLPEGIGVTIQVPRTRARLVTPTAGKTATSRTAAASVRSGLALGAPDQRGRRALQ